MDAGILEGLTRGPALNRLGCATNTQTMINTSSAISAAKSDSMLHQAELILHDSMEFDFAHSMLTDAQYEFIHLYSSAIYKLFHELDREGITMRRFLAILQAGVTTVNTIIEKDNASDDYNPTEDKELIALRQSLQNDIERFAFDLIPAILTAVSMIPLHKEASHDERWQANTLESAVDFFTIAQALLLKRGIGDRE